MVENAQSKDGVTELASGWNLVEANSWEISVGPDGLLMLPRHVAPDEIDDFIAAMQKAAVVGARIRKRNADAAAKRVKSPGEQLLSTILVTESGESTPEGAVRLGVSPRGE